MNYFPNNNEEKELLDFIAKYQYLNVNDVKYFFNTKKYYKKRITNLVSKKFLRRIKLNLVLDELGFEYIKLLGKEYSKLNRNKKYLPRLLYLSNIGAFYHRCKTIRFIPSFLMKDKEMFTITSRKFIGILNINGIKYLTYHISKNHDKRYVASVIYDIQKERKYKNIIVFVDNVKMINRNDFAFGNNQVLIIEDTEENREKLKFLNNIDWHKALNNIYKNKVYLSEYNFCDYTDYKNRYISTLFVMLK